ncbi:MAG: M42 family metallopeptidase [Bacillota bacterium]|nr:M42 family metallopeptidase [Bacillota bacterium]
MELRSISELRGVSGQEHEVRTYLRRELEGHVSELQSDTLGNLFARKPAAARGPTVMFAAHMDEVGFLVTAVDKDGMVHFRTVGGIDAGVMPSKVVQIGPKAVPGVIGTKAVHLQSADDRTKPFDPKKLVIDIGAGSKEEALKLVQPGDQVTFATSFGAFGNGLHKGRALDDRIGCAVLVEVLKGSYQVPVVGVFTVQEEVGTRGAAVASYAVRPDIGVCLEGTVCADIPGTEEDAETTRIGSGPAISIMDAGTIHHPGLVHHLVAVARRHEIPYQYRRATRGGNDAARMSLAGSGAKACAVSVPCRYIHGPVAVASQSDFENAVKLLRAFLESIGRGELKV